MIHRIIQAIRIGVVAEYSLSGREHDVSGEESAGLRVIVPGLQIVPLCLFVVNIASVAERVQYSQRARQRSRAVQLLSPGVVSVFHDGVFAVVNELYYVSLSVPEIVVIRSVEADSLYFSSLVVEEQQDIVSCGQSHQYRTVVIVIRRSDACGLLRPQSVLVVSVGVRSRRDELLSFPG